MARRLFTFASGVSLVACVLLTTLWARGYFQGDLWHFAPGPPTGTTTSPWGQTDTWRTQWSIHSGRGRLQIVRRELQLGQGDPPGHAVAPPGQAISELAGGITNSDRWFNSLGFGYFKRDKA